MALALSLGLAGNLAASAGQEFALALFGVAQLLAESAQRARVNKAAVLALSRRVDQFVTAVATELGERENEYLSDEWLQQLTNFQRALVDTQELLAERETRSYLSQVIHQERDAQKIQEISARLSNEFSVLMLQWHMQADQLVKSIADPLKNSTVLQTLDSHAAALDVSEPELSMPLLSKIYFGRVAETQRVVDVFTTGASTYVAVLGGPGIGKSSFCVAVGNSPSIVSRYGQRRFFVSCDAADGQQSCLHVIAGAFGIASPSRSAMEKKLAGLLGSAPALVVLDNFESAWEARESREDAETVLQFLASIPGLSLLVAIRGSERPHGISWTRPHLPPLSPLDEVAAAQTFLSICDKSEDDPYLFKLLKPLDGVPLAIILMANLAQVESLDALSQRWSDARTKMLQRGNTNNRSNSLDLSITVSISSSRIAQAPNALHILSLLSLLPNGTMDSDVRLWAPAFRDHARLVSVLLQTSLVFRTPEGRIRVLAPIREFMLLYHPPIQDHLRPVLQHFFSLADLALSDDGKFSSSPEAIVAITPEVDNISCVIRYALRTSEEQHSAVRAAERLLRLYKDTGIGSADILHDALAVARSAQFDELAADIIFQWAMLSYNTTIQGNPAELYKEARALYERAGNITGIIETTTALMLLLDAPTAIELGRQMCSLAEERKDYIRVAQCNQRLADVYARSSRQVDARACHERAILALRSADKPNLRLVAYSKFRIAVIDYSAGNLRSCITSLIEAIDIFTATYSSVAVRAARILLGTVYIELGDLALAAKQLQMSVAESRGVGDAARELDSLLTLASAYISSGDLEAAIDTLKAADRTLEPLGDDWSYVRAQALHCKGELALHTGDLAAARALLYAAIATTRKRDRVVSPEYLLQREAEILVTLGYVNIDEQRVEDATACFTVGLLVQLKMDYPIQVIRCLAGLAHTFEDDTAEAILAAILLPLHRFSMRRLLADVLLHSARIAQHRGQPQVAHRHASSALRHYDATNDLSGTAQANDFLRSNRI